MSLEGSKKVSPVCGYCGHSYEGYGLTEEEIAISLKKGICSTCGDLSLIESLEKEDICTMMRCLPSPKASETPSFYGCHCLIFFVNKIKMY